MKEYHLESSVRQHWTSKLKIFDNGLGVIENFNTRTKKTTKVFLNQQTAQKFYDSMFREHITTITPSNWFTVFLCRIGVVSMTVTSKYEDKNK